MAKAAYEKDGRRLLSGGRLLALTGVLCALSLIIMLAALKGTAPKAPAFTPPPFEPAAQTGVPDVPEDLGWSEVKADHYSFSVCGVFCPEKDSVDLWLTNPENSGVWMKLRLLDTEGNILGETGLITPGEYVQSVALDPIPKSGDLITMRLMAYEPDSYFSAGAANLNVTVK